MSQSTPIIPPDQSGLNYRLQDNDGKLALLSQHKGATAPAYAVAGAPWIDDAATPWLFKIYDGADWVVIGAINPTNNSFSPYQGTAALRYLNHAADSGVADAYVIAPVPVITAYTVGQIVTLQPANANTGAATLAVSGLPAKDIKLSDGTDPIPGNLLTSGVYLLMYDGTNFILLNPTLDVAGGNVKVSSNDTTPAPLATKLVAGSDIILTENNDGANETLEIGFNGEYQPLAPRVRTLTSAATIFPEATDDLIIVGALAEALFFGSPDPDTAEGQVLIVRIKDDGIARDITWNTDKYRPIGVTLPSKTVVGKTLYIAMIWNTSVTPYAAYDVVSVVQEA